MTRLLWMALLACGCGHEGNAPGDAGLDARPGLALTVDGPPAVQATRTLTVTITANGHTRRDSFVIGGLPTTVELAQPIQLSTWAIRVDGFDPNGEQIGRGSAEVPAGTTEAMVTLAPSML